VTTSKVAQDMGILVLYLRNVLRPKFNGW
jgi:hypothetical protein